MESRPGTEVSLLKIITKALPVLSLVLEQNRQIKVSGNANLINFWWIITKTSTWTQVAPLGRRPTRDSSCNLRRFELK